MGKTCTICGGPLPPDRCPSVTRCPDCRSTLHKYNKFCKTIFKSSPTAYLLEFRNILMDLKYNSIPTAKLPYDLDYQLDRVNRYLAGDSD